MLDPQCSSFASKEKKKEKKKKKKSVTCPNKATVSKRLDVCRVNFRCHPAQGDKQNAKWPWIVAFYHGIRKATSEYSTEYVGRLLSPETSLTRGATMLSQCPIKADAASHMPRAAGGLLIRKISLSCLFTPNHVPPCAPPPFPPLMEKRWCLVVFGRSRVEGLT